uniref:Uncharacterized protein n=1 Tax=Arundo donax TaxID=35708 RepID=A0A0A8YGQ5_ARUDO
MSIAVLLGCFRHVLSVNQTKCFP